MHTLQLGSPMLTLQLLIEPPVPPKLVPPLPASLEPVPPLDEPPTETAPPLPPELVPPPLPVAQILAQCAGVEPPHMHMLKHVVQPLHDPLAQLLATCVGAPPTWSTG